MPKTLTNDTLLCRGDVLLNTLANEHYIVAMVDHDLFALISLHNGNRYTAPQKTDRHRGLSITAKILISESASCKIDRWQKIEVPLHEFSNRFFKNTGVQKCNG